MTFEGRKEQGITRNISLGGMYLEISSTVLLDATVQVRFRVPTQSEPIEVTGSVRWIEPSSTAGPSGVGVRFHGLRARDVWALNRYFQS